MDELHWLAAGFAAYQHARGLSPATIDVRHMVVELFADWLDPASLLSAKRLHVEGFLADRRKRCCASSLNNYLSHLRAFYRWCQREGHVTVDPTALVDRSKTRKRVPRPIPEADFFQAMRMANRRMRCWLVLAGFAGLRCKEIAGLRVDDLLFDTQTIVVSDPKGHEERTVPMHPIVELALRDYGVPMSGVVFPSDAHPRAPFTARQVSTRCNGYLHGLGITSTMHKARSRFGTLTYRESRDLVLVARLMGHKSTLTTEDYVLVTPGADAVKVVASLPVSDQHPTLF